MDGHKAKGKHKGTMVIVVIVAAVGVLVAYLWHKDKTQAAATTQGSSQPLATATPTTGVQPVMQPNSFSSTPVLQNYVSNMTTTNVSSQPVITHFHQKHWSGPPHPPHSPHMTPSGRGR